MNIKIAYGLPALITAGTIFYVSSLERIELPLSQISFNDLIFHSFAYFLFGLTLVVAAYPWHTSFDYPLRTYSILIGIGILYGLSDEIHQYFVPNRSCTISDFLADSIGVIISIIAAKIWIKKRDVSKLRKSANLWENSSIKKIKDYESLCSVQIISIVLNFSKICTFNFDKIGR